MTKFNQAIIIGASSGIGEALARELVNNGCIVALVARRGDLLDKLCSEINSNSDKIKAYSYVHDVVNIDEVPELFQVITRQLGRLDAIFYTAGTMAKITKDEYDTSKDSLMIKVNTIGAIAWINEAARRFERIKKGTIVGVSSVAGDRGRSRNPAYCSSKAALNTYLESIRNRIGKLGVKVLTIKPGFIDTEMTKGTKGLFWLISPESAAKMILKSASKGRKISYIPARWRLVMFIIKSIPSFIFRRLSI
ncbi:MAG: SDR family NAD(P)-dependent oxidoreductase [Chlorobiota bacterium]|nr:SDR family NAD(P)-dependent oxidoreductase [Chlorobiota bacterium]QQS67156.1 MAG: SDR family NAD(P)-dependent oxidoreductase [Chlorobiota bacterium]